MSDKKTKFSPVKIPIFLMIGAVAIMFTDLIILDGERQMPQIKTMVQDFMRGDDVINVSHLRAQHEIYLTEGVDMPMQFTRESARPDPLVSAISNVPDVAEEPTNTQISILTLEDILAREREEEIASIEPASGVEGDLNVDFAFSAPILEYDDVLEGSLQAQEDMSIGPNDDNEISDVMSGLGVQDHALLETTKIDDRPKDQDEAVDYTYIEPKTGGKIAIIIDDMGLNLRSKLVELMPAPLTLAYLPYAKNLAEHTARARKNGHELMVHMPMEPMNGALDGGPRVLKTTQSDEELRDTLHWGLSQFDGYVGMNNHMGSRITQDKRAMRVIMKDLKARGLFFIDSKTIGASVAADAARDVGLDYAERDVFLDHEISMEFIRGALKKLEDTARHKGYAIAIGHPHKETIAALKEWLPTVRDKGLTIVPVSELLKHSVDNGRVAGTQ